MINNWRVVRVLMWDVHGSYTDALTAGRHDYLFLPPDPVTGRGGLTRYGASPPVGSRVAEPDELIAQPPDVVLLQRTEELELCRAALGLTPGRDLPAIFLEHNVPRENVPSSRHPLAGSVGVSVVHVTHVNDLLWDCGPTATAVIEHGLADPGLRYQGDLERWAFVVNEPVRRMRVTGTDLLSHFDGVDAYGIDGDLLPGLAELHDHDVVFGGDLRPEPLRDALSHRRAYLHLNRWTSLGLSLIEAMLLGLPVLVLDTTAASRTVPPEAGALSSDPRELAAEARVLRADPDEAARRGRIARRAALRRHGLDRFLRDWDAAFTAAAA